MRLPLSGCAVGAVDACLYGLGGFLKASALKMFGKMSLV